ARGHVIYAVGVAHRRPATSSAVVVDDLLPPGATLVSITPSQGNCSGTSCLLGVLAIGERATITLIINAPAVAGRIVNSAAVHSSTSDPGLKNNSATSAVMVVIPVKK